ncbi:MAG: LysE family translocator [Limnochordia bacterium]|jgi:threonine/homoserine/homoserine lactone efflux protein
MFIFLSAFTIGLSGAMMPGPLLTVTIAQSARRGFWAGPLLVLGHGLLELTLIGGLILGLQQFLTRPGVMGPLGLIGGSFLLWMGWGILRSARHTYLDTANEGAQGSWGPVLAGVVTSISNPYWILWWATIGASYITIATAQGWHQVIAFFSGHLLADLLWYSLVALMIATGKQWLKPKVYQGILFLCGLALVALAGYFIWDGWQLLALGT